MNSKPTRHIAGFPEKVIERLTGGMIRNVFISSTLCFHMNVFGSDIMVPPPKTMLERSDLIAIARISKLNNDWILTIDETLKGSAMAGDKIEMFSEFPPALFTFDQTYKLVNGEPFLFVGVFDPITGTARPRYGAVSFWPQGDVYGKVLPSRSLAECVDFAKQNLAIPLPQTVPGLPRSTNPTNAVTGNQGAIAPRLPEESRSNDTRMNNSPSVPSSNHDRGHALLIATFVVALGLTVVILYRRIRKSR